MSLAPKIDEVRYFVMDKKPDLAAFTETWLDDSIGSVSGYNLICKNRTSGSHGGVCLNIKNSIPFKTMDHLYHPNIKVLWVHTRPTRLPRGVPCVVIGTVYHPPKADDRVILYYLIT